METHTFLKPYIPAMINQVEEWLSSKSEDGWNLLSYNGWRFVFVREEKSPKRKQYFMYSGFDSTMGFSNDFFSARERYGSKKSSISKKEYRVFEIDTHKKDQHFSFYINARNNYYKKHYIGLSVLSFFMLLLSIPAIYEPVLYPLYIIIGLVFFYAIISLFIISFDKTNQGTVP